MKGKSYLIESGKVTTADGTEVAKTELEHVSMDVGVAFEPPSRPLRPGDIVEKDGNKLTFEKRDGDVGVFKWAMVEKGQPDIEATCSARVRIKDTRLLSVKCGAKADGGDMDVIHVIDYTHLSQIGP